MKAAVLHEIGGVPRYEDFPDPIPGDDEIVLEVKAVAVENVDKAIAAGRHYTAARYLSELPMIPCFDGAGALPDGTIVGFANPRAPYGALAEQTVVPAGNLGPIPEGLDPAAAVTLTSAMPTVCAFAAAGFTAGETVLIQGATGVAGRLAVKIARLMGAGRIVATGRDGAALHEITALGADSVITTAVSDDELRRQFTDAKESGYDVVVDFLWGRPTEILLSTLIPDSFALPTPIRLVQIGESAGPTATISAEALRTSGVEIYGAARNADPAAIGAGYLQVVEWARDGRLTFEIEQVPLTEVETAWQRTDLRGKRLVVTP
ncbi:zinc-binding alcohol dehydrogenase family protein [Nocardia sp. NPDC088792]|uniref:quinone oxidoreductase family protein n=1 Tax=Nocardia sp. NPDC088792 TaxID=3364332 RepID=UPI00382B5282